MIEKGLARLFLWIIMVACAAVPSSAGRLDRVPKGEWGGEHVRLSVEKAGGMIEFDCAHGSLDEPLALDSAGRFDVKGRLATEGGPVRKDDTGTGRPARYRGESDGRRMSLEVTLEGGENVGTFTLTRGGAARLFKCR